MPRRRLNKVRKKLPKRVKLKPTPTMPKDVEGGEKKQGKKLIDTGVR